MRLALPLALFLLALAPCASAVDLLPTEVSFGKDEARLLVRSSTGSVQLTAEPSVRAGGAEPGGVAHELASTPLTLEATYVWRGIDGIVEVVLQRDDPRVAIDIIIEDGANTGVWVEWPAERRAIPGVSALLVLPFLGLRRRRDAT